MAGVLKARVTDVAGNVRRTAVDDLRHKSFVV